jgi:hypothetical protein
MYRHIQKLLRSERSVSILHMVISTLYADVTKYPHIRILSWKLITTENKLHVMKYFIIINMLANDMIHKILHEMSTPFGWSLLKGYNTGLL